MRLTKDEEKMLSGGYGEGYKRAMEILVEMGKFYDAKRMVPDKHGVPDRRSQSGANRVRRANGSMKWRTWATTFKCPLLLVPLDSSTFQRL